MAATKDVKFDERDLLYISKLPRSLRAKLETLTGRSELNRPPRWGQHWAEKRAAKSEASRYLLNDQLRPARLVTIEEAAKVFDLSPEDLAAKLAKGYRREHFQVIDGREVSVTYVRPKK